MPRPNEGTGKHAYKITLREVGLRGNVVMAALCFMLDAMGYGTGVDLKKLVAVRALVAQALPDLSMQCALARAGLPQGYVAAAERQAA